MFTSKQLKSIVVVVLLVTICASTGCKAQETNTKPNLMGRGTGTSAGSSAESGLGSQMGSQMNNGMGSMGGPRGGSMDGPMGGQMGGSMGGPMGGQMGGSMGGPMGGQMGNGMSMGRYGMPMSGGYGSGMPMMQGQRMPTGGGYSNGYPQQQMGIRGSFLSMAPRNGRSGMMGPRQFSSMIGQPGAGYNMYGG